MKILAVDPSVNNIGLACYNSDTKELRTQLFHPKKGREKAAMGIEILRHVLLFFLQGEKVDYMVVEYPNWQGSAKGLIAMQKGYTLDLAFVCGILAAGLPLSSNKIFLPTPLEWKGNAPKSATEYRVKKRFGILQISEHEYDALGLLMYAMEKVGVR